MPKQPQQRAVGLDRNPDARPGAHDDKARAPAKLSLRGLLKAVFVDQLRLRRDGPHLKIALEAAAATTAPAALPQAPPLDPPVARLRVMQRALRELLDSRASSRDVLKHLSALEHQLGLHVQPFIHDLSLSSLQHMLRQLHGLIAPPAPPGIAMLLGDLLDAAELKTRLDQTQAAARAQAISSFFVDHKLVVKELSPSMLELPGEVESEAAGK